MLGRGRGEISFLQEEGHCMDKSSMRIRVLTIKKCGNKENFHNKENFSRRSRVYDPEGLLMHPMMKTTKYVKLLPHDSLRISGEYVANRVT